MSFRMSSIQFMTNYKSSLNKTYREQAKILEQGDGTSIHRGSDDPIGYSKLLRYNVSASENDQYHKNVDTAISWMKTSDSVVATMAARMQTFTEKTVAAANSYHTDADFQAIGKEMFAQIEEIVSEANSQQGDRYIFSGQKDTTEPFLLSHDTYERGLSKTLDSKQAAFFKGTSGDDNATLFQMLTLEYQGDTYYLDTQSGYVYSKKFVDEGYKELITQGYPTIKTTDRINTDTNIAETYAVGKIGSMSLSQAWKRVSAATEDELVRTINATNINDGDDDELREALKVLYNEDLTTVENRVTLARDALANSLKDVSHLEYEMNHGNRAEITTVSWNPYDKDTGAISTTATTVWGSTWNGTGIAAKSNFADDLISAVDGYATGEYSVSDGDGDNWAADDAASSVLVTLSSQSPTEDLTADVTADQIDTLAQREVIRLAVLASKDYKEPSFKVADGFTNRGELLNDVAKKDKIATVQYGLEQTDGTYPVTGVNVYMFDVAANHTVTVSKNPEPFNFVTIKQKLVSYQGDFEYISMVKMNGANDKSSDLVNLHGSDLFGYDIFDNEESGNEYSGCAMLNNMLTVYTKTNACDELWLTSDGVTLSDVSHATIIISETTLGSRLNLYESVSEMLDNQSTTITNDITNVSGTDVAELATKLMEITTLYNMALSLGGRVLPQSLADYL